MPILAPRAWRPPRLAASSFAAFLLTRAVDARARTAPIVFGWPAFFYLRSSKVHGRRVGLTDRVICGLFLAVFLPLFTVLGTIDAVRSIVDDLSSSGGPFQC